MTEPPGDPIPASDAPAPHAADTLPPAPTAPEEPDEVAPAPAPGGAPPPDGPEDATPPVRPRPRPLASRIVLAVAAVVLAGAVAWHLGSVFLSIAPSTPVSRAYQNAVAAHVYPEFEQNWQLFAPNPLQENIGVQARVETLAPDGSRTDSGWIDLTAQDIGHIRGNPAPSHADQNLLRRAWDFYDASHTTDERPIGDRGPLSATYLKRIALQRVGRDWQGLPVVQIQIRASSTPVTGPSWTGAPPHATTSFRTLPWWPVDDTDYQGLS